MRLTTRTNLATRVLMYCAVNADGQHRSVDIAKACNVSINHLMQVVPALHRAGFVRAARGRSGGVSLARPAHMVSVGEVFRLFESGRPFAECFDPESNTCPLTLHCLLRPALEAALEAFYERLDGVTLAALVTENTGLAAILAASGPQSPIPGCSNGAPGPLGPPSL